MLLLSVLDCAAYDPSSHSFAWTAQSSLALREMVHFADAETVVFLSGEAVDLSSLPVAALGARGAVVFSTTRLDQWQPKTSTAADGARYRHLYLPNAAFCFSQMRSYSPLALLRAGEEEEEEVERKKGVAYLYFNCRPEREEFFRLLKQHFLAANITDEAALVALGRCGRGEEAASSSFSSSRFEVDFIDRAVEMYKSFQLVVCFENSFARGYLTEKLVAALLAGAVPVFVGSAVDVRTHFNERAMIICEEVADLSHCAERVVEVLKSRSLYSSMRAEALLKGTSERERKERLKELFFWHPIAADTSIGRSFIRSMRAL